jgi:lipoprotein-anchoring transpeptidase ErfK/SrfK
MLMSAGGVRSHAVLFALAFVLSLGAAGPAASAAESLPPGAPAWVSPAGGTAAKLADVALVAGSETASVTVYLDGAPIGSTECTGGQLVAFGRVAMHAGVSTFRVAASNAAGDTRTFDYTVRRLEYPWPTCIVVDKSDFRLYWVRGEVLVKVYPIAHGKRRTPTPNAVWKVGRKEKTPPRGVYGPRKLRLFRRVVYRTRRGRVVRFRYTNYGIHGTNEPWVIGTMASHGCIRLTNSQILDLWPQVPLGTPVLTRQ